MNLAKCLANNTIEMTLKGDSPEEILREKTMSIKRMTGINNGTD
jgi:hypothetical protein